MNIHDILKQVQNHYISVAKAEELLAKYRAFKAEPKRGLPRQDSTTDQLVDVMKAANNMGCYDAADVIRGIIERKAEQEPLAALRMLAGDKGFHGVRVKGWAEIYDSGVIVADNINGVRSWRQTPCWCLYRRGNDASHEV